MKSVLQMTILLVVILLVTFYMLFPKKEGFVNLSGVTSSALYMGAGKSATFNDMDANFKAMEGTLGDKGNLLYMRRCYQFPNETLENLRKNLTYSFHNDGMYFTDFDMVTCQFNDVESRIVCELQKFKEKLCGNTGKLQCGPSRSKTQWAENIGCSAPVSFETPKQTSEEADCTQKIQGPVYAFVFQAPYYRAKDPATNEERTIALQFQTLDTMLMPYNGNQAENDANTPIFIYVQLLFPRYNKNGTFVPAVNYMDQYYFPEWDRKYFSKEMQCFIKTVKKYDMVGGCATTNSPYEAKCLGPKTALNFDSKDEKNTISTYGIIYQVNANYALFNDLFATNVATFSPPIRNPEVYHVKGNFKDVGDAISACDKVNGGIASREDVYDAYAAGLNVCEQGFVSDGFVATSSQGNIASCQGPKKFSIDYHTNQKNVGAFCYGERPQNDPNVNKWDARAFASKFDWLKVSQNKIQQKCGTFSEEKYFEQYPDAKSSGITGLQHWVTQGIAKGYKGFLKESDGSGSFDENMYNALYKGKTKKLEGIQHLQQEGIMQENRVCIK